jgi:hypothetical protein
MIEVYCTVARSGPADENEEGCDAPERAISG